MWNIAIQICTGNGLFRIDFGQLSSVYNPLGPNLNNQ